MSSTERAALKIAPNPMGGLPTPPTPTNPATTYALNLSSEVEKKLRDAPVIYIKRVVSGCCCEKLYYEVYAGPMDNPGEMLIKVRSWKEMCILCSCILCCCKNGLGNFEWPMPITKGEEQSYGLMTLSEGPGGMPVLTHTNDDYLGKIRSSYQVCCGCFSTSHNDIVGKFEVERYSTKKPCTFCDCLCSVPCCSLLCGGCCSSLIKSYKYSQTNNIAFEIFERCSICSCIASKLRRPCICGPKLCDNVSHLEIVKVGKSFPESQLLLVSAAVAHTFSF